MVRRPKGALKIFLEHSLDVVFYDQPTTEAPTVEKSSAAKDPTDPPSHVGSQPAATNVGAMGESSQCRVIHAVSVLLRDLMEEY